VKITIEDDAKRKTIEVVEARAIASEDEVKRLQTKILELAKSEADSWCAFGGTESFLVETIRQYTPEKVRRYRRDGKFFEVSIVVAVNLTSLGDYRSHDALWTVDEFLAYMAAHRKRRFRSGPATAKDSPSDLGPAPNLVSHPDPEPL